MSDLGATCRALQENFYKSSYMACLSHLLVPDRSRPTVYPLGFEKYGQQEVHTLAKGTWHLTIFSGVGPCVVPF